MTIVCLLVCALIIRSESAVDNSALEKPNNIFPFVVTDQMPPIGNSSTNTFLDFDKKNSQTDASFLAKNVPSPLRKALILTLETSSVQEFLMKCLRTSTCTRDQVIKGVGGKPWKFRISHRRGIMHFAQVYECCAFNRASACPVDGQWSRWASWGACSQKCGNGVRTRKRTCSSPAPENYGKFCSGTSTDKEPCSQKCPKNYAEMAGEDPLKRQALENLQEIESKYSAIKGFCSKEHCTYQQVHNLIGDETTANQYWLSIHCVERFVGCPVDGGWSDWEPWSSCSSECGIGERFRLRRCNDPTPGNGGLPCEGELFEKEDCLGVSCGEDGGNDSGSPVSMWTDWSDWSTCSAKNCEVYGTEFSKRLCIGLTMPALCAVGDGTHKASLERKRPCIKKGCLPEPEPMEENTPMPRKSKEGLVGSEDEENSERLEEANKSPHRKHKSKGKNMPTSGETDLIEHNIPLIPGDDDELLSQESEKENGGTINARSNYSLLYPLMLGDDEHHSVAKPSKTERGVVTTSYAPKLAARAHRRHRAQLKHMIRKNNKINRKYREIS